MSVHGDSVSSFRLITPVRRALYVEGMAACSLPLPVLRWGPGAVGDYVIQFSDSLSFERRYQIHVGPHLFYQLTAADEKKAVKLSAIKKVYWRVVSGTEQTKTRVFRFAPLLR